MNTLPLCLKRLANSSSTLRVRRPGSHFARKAFPNSAEQQVSILQRPACMPALEPPGLLLPPQWTA